MGSEPSYRRIAELMGSQGPINALAFSPNGQRLASGGDDGCVRIWSIANGTCAEVLRPRYDSRFEILGWGQITTILWISSGDSNEESVRSHLFFGTARGLLVGADFHNIKAGGLGVLSSSKRYLVLGNQSGLIRVYKLQIAAGRYDLQLHWHSNESEEIPSIPRNLAFWRGYLLIFWLEAGQISYCELRDDENETEQGKLEFDGGIIGNACLSDPPDYLLIHNLVTGNFDNYDFPALSKRHSLEGGSRIPVVKQAIFAERNKVAVCGSDDGSVYVYDVRSGVLLQRLTQCQHQKIHRLCDLFRRRKTGDVSIQTVAHFTSKERYLLASGSSTTEGTIAVWEKPTSRAWRNDTGYGPLRVIGLSTVAVLAVITCWLSYDRYSLVRPS
ncbi:hypothetical protein PQX77_008170 [Marasmius sp. AFHP31]|nr:hypothetical protein PQX77_008170 [Marasmius sp. AFHP31]